MQAIAWVQAAQARRSVVRVQSWIEAEQGRFVLWLPVFMGTGVLAYFSLRYEPALWIGAALVAATVALFVLTAPFQMARMAAAALLACALGFASGQFATWRAAPVEPLPRRAVVLSGIVRSVELLPGSRRVTLSDVSLAQDGVPLPRTVRIRLRASDPVALAAGDTVRIRALLRSPAPPAYPGAWDLQRDAFFSGLAGSGTALNAVEMLQHASPQGVARWWQSVRDAVGHRVIVGLPGPAGAIAATLLTGTSTAIAPADRAAFRDSGLAHILAVAGLHIGIVMGLAIGAARMCLAASERVALHWPTKSVAAVAALGAGAFYMLLTGGHIPILRSFAMASLVTLGLAFGRRVISLRGLAVAAVAIMLIAPNEVAGVSFQMSFSAVLALISGYEALRPYLNRLRGNGAWWRRLSLHVLALALTSLLAGTASAPFGAYHFGHVQLYFIIANIAAVPLTAMWVMPLGLIALALMPLGLEQIALVPMGWGASAILWIGRTVSAWPAATSAVPHMPAWGLCVLSGGLAWLGLWRTRARLTGVVAIAVGLISPLVARPPDLLVSPDARLIGVRTDHLYVQSRSGASKFVFVSWQQYMAKGLALPLPESAPGIECASKSCSIKRDETTAILLRQETRLPDCADIAILISADPARDACPPGVPYVDRFSVRRDGAYAIWLTRSGPIVLSDREYRGARPWVPPIPLPRHVVPNLPLAPAEDLGPAPVSSDAKAPQADLEP